MASHSLCEEPYDDEQLRRQEPEAHIVHSKAPFFSKTALAIRDYYWRILGRFPIKATEQANWEARIANHSASLDDVERAVCHSQQYLIRMKMKGSVSDSCTRMCIQEMNFANHPCYRCCGPAFERVAWQRAIPVARPYVFTSDLHTGPMACSEPILNELGARVHSEVDFGNCMCGPAATSKLLPRHR